jgi:hypothetical protein
MQEWKANRVNRQRFEFMPDPSRLPLIADGTASAVMTTDSVDQISHLLGVPPPAPIHARDRTVWPIRTDQFRLELTTVESSGSDSVSDARLRFEQLDRNGQVAASHSMDAISAIRMQPESSTTDSAVVFVYEDATSIYCLYVYPNSNARMFIREQ